MSLTIEEHTMSDDVERSEVVDDFLNESYAEVTIFGCSFDPADILFKLDPVAYRCLALDLEDKDN